MLPAQGETVRASFYSLGLSFSMCTKRTRRDGLQGSGLWDLRVSCSLLGTSAFSNMLLSEASQDSGAFTLPVLSPIALSSSEAPVQPSHCKWVWECYLGTLGPAVGEGGEQGHWPVTPGWKERSIEPRESALLGGLECRFPD